MKQYKCINCGELKECEEACSCSVCGYKMFPLPYERAEMLRREIREFVGKLQEGTAAGGKLVCYREEDTGRKDKDGKPVMKTVLKEEDDKRFPGFRTIREYICNAPKTEGFIERLDESIEQIQKYIAKPYTRRYRVDAERIKKEAEKYDESLKKVLTALELECDLPELQLPEISLLYSETPDPELQPTADRILSLLLGLSHKIFRFIKQNNIYGTSYRADPGSLLKPGKRTDFKALLLFCSKQVEDVLSKNYVVDLLSDGFDEVSDLLKTVWIAMESVMTAPVLACKRTYTLDDGTAASDNGLRDILRERIARRYSELNAIVDAGDFLSGRTEEELFALYDKMIELDPAGLMGVERSGLLRIGESEKKLNGLIGLSGIKESVKKIKAYAVRNRDSKNLNVHMCFLGNPCCGKTEVARFIAGILYENKILPKKKVTEVDRSGLVSEYFGATAEKTRRVIEQAMGGVLFIDEAYALGNNSDGGITDYGREAIDTLVKAMEDRRGEFCVIFAGYRNEMQKMLSVNPGLKSRIQFTLDFPNYSREELCGITKLMLEARGYSIGDAALNRILDITDVKRKDPNFANAREIRNILDQVIMCQNLRCVDSSDTELGMADVNKYIQDAKINLPTAASGNAGKILTGEEELDQLIGLAPVKRMVRKIKAYAKRNQGQPDFNLHMCFYGNPGTGKTEVARILSRILYDAGVLEEAKLVETDAHGLIGRYVGETAPKTLAKIDEAMGGVLFIDEAYALADGNAASKTVTGYGEEAIAVLLKEMEDRRGRFCAILAGYRDEMTGMLSSNPGFESRIQFTLEFPDYTREELGLIARSFLEKKNYTIGEDALSRVLDIVEFFRRRPNFANARTVRNILDQVLMNQNLRTEDRQGDNEVILDDVEDYLADEGIDLAGSNAGAKRIGFL